MTSTKEKLTATSTSLLVPPSLRKNSGAASTTMRKYQQLTLAIVSVISLMAFLFYKHEYDRLQYTLGYLEMFGSSPGDFGSSNSLCSGSNNRKLYTTPNLWIKLSDDIVVYSAFWDEGNGLTIPSTRTIAVVKKSDKPPYELKSRILFDSDASVSAVCSLEEIKLKRHTKYSPVDNKIKVTNLICKAEISAKNVPYLIQFKIGDGTWAPPILIQESESWKSVANVTCACVYSSQVTISSVRLIEFISHHSGLGVEKFVFFGPILTPLVRKLLDKYSGESNIFYEEKSFNLPTDFALNDVEIRAVVERDCIYRHRDTHENVLVLKLNEFIVPRAHNSLQDVLSSTDTRDAAAVSEFHFVSQKVCIDEMHTKVTDLLLDSQVRSSSANREIGMAVMRPHLFTSGAGFSAVTGVSYTQHIPSSIANIYSFGVCSNDDTHEESDHLPNYARFGDMIRKSVLYIKWKLNS